MLIRQRGYRTGVPYAGHYKKANLKCAVLLYLNFIQCMCDIKTLTCFVRFELNMFTELLSTGGEDAPDFFKKTLNVECSWGGVL